MINRAALIAAAGALLLSACNQALTTAANPRPQASPPRQTNEQIARETLARLVALERESGGSVYAAQTQQTMTAVEAATSTPAGQAEVLRLQDVLVRLRALNAAPDASRQ